MAKPSPTQIAWRRRLEAGLRVAAPFLDLLLVAGDRVSRIVERQEPEYPPPLPAPGMAVRSVGRGGGG